MDTFHKLKSSLGHQIQRVRSQQDGRFLPSAMSHISQMELSYRQSDLGDLRQGSPEDPRSPSPESSESSELQKAQEQISQLLDHIQELTTRSSRTPPPCRGEINTPLFSSPSQILLEKT